MPPPNPALAELCSVLGENETRIVVRSFLQSFPATFHELSRGDRERGRRAAHSLKSSAHQMGATELSKCMAALETKLARPDGVVTPADLAETAAAFGAAAGPLRTFVG